MRSASSRVKEETWRTKTPFDAAASQWPAGVDPDTFDKGLTEEQARSRIGPKPAVTNQEAITLAYAGYATV
jgi:hypothetical protein